MRHLLAGGEPNLKPSTTSAATDRQLVPALPRSKSWFMPLTLLACGTFLYLQMFVLPATPRIASGDQAIYLHHATRMLEGQLIYRDYDHFTLPGTDVLYATLFRLFGVRAWIPQAMLVLIGVINAWLGIVISRKLLTGGMIFLPSLLFLTLPFSSYPDATHHWYSALAAVAALASAIETRSVVRMACAGALWGLGTCFSQSTALGTIGFALFLLWERPRNGEPWGLLFRKEASLFGSFLATVALFNSYFVWKVGLKRLLYCTVVFVAKYYSADRFNTWRVYLREWPSVHSWPNWVDLPAWPFVHILVPWVYIFFFLFYRLAGRSRSELAWERLMLVNITGLSLFLAIASAPAYNRMYTVSLPAILLLVWFASSLVALGRILSPILWTMIVGLAILKPIVTQTRWKAYLDLPTVRTAFFQPEVYEKTKWVAERTRPSEYFFGDQLLCFALALRNPARVPFLRPTDYTRPEEVQDVIQALREHQVGFVSWYGGLDVPDKGVGDHLAPLRLYLRDHYHVGKTFSNGDKIWEHNNVPSQSLNGSMTSGGGAGGARNEQLLRPSLPNIFRR
jgi:hypothetical protein